MLTQHAVTDIGYKILEKTGLKDEIDEHWDRLRLAIPLSKMFEDYLLLKKEIILKDPNIDQSRKSQLEKIDLSKFDSDEEFFVASGELTDILLPLLSEDKRTPESFGLENLAVLDRLIGSYALEKYSIELQSGPQYTWRSKGQLTSLYGDDVNGGLRLSQINTTPKNDEHLYGKLPLSFVSSYSGSWPHLAAIALKFADEKEITLSKSTTWRNFLREYGWDGTIQQSSTGVGVGYESFVSEFLNYKLAEVPDNLDQRKMKKMFFGRIYAESADVHYYPVIDEEENLVFCSNVVQNKEEKTFTLNEQTYYPTVKILKEDMDMLFNRTIYAIMTGQSRTRPEFLAMMLWEHEQIKEGKTEEEISKLWGDLRERTKVDDLSALL